MKTRKATQVTLGPRTILIIDDDVDFVEATSVPLEKRGYHVVKAYDGREGLRLAKIAPPDLVIMDIMMGERTEGFFTVQEMRQTTELRSVPIFVVSSLYSRIEEFKIAPEREWLAHDEFFPKPVDTEKLLKSIDRRLSDDH